MNNLLGLLSHFNNTNLRTLLAGERFFDFRPCGTDIRTPRLSGSRICGRDKGEEQFLVGGDLEEVRRRGELEVGDEWHFYGLCRFEYLARDAE